MSTGRPAGTILLSNQSAMGLYLFAWTEDGRACSVMWGRGDAAPMFTYRSEIAGRDITVPIVNPGRFGWPLAVPAGRQTPTSKVFQGFVQRFAQDMHGGTREGLRMIKHVVRCRDCGETWVDEDEECTCTCTDPEMETWTVAELCADCGQPMDGHPGYQGWSTGCSWPCRGKPKDAAKTGDQ